MVSLELAASTTDNCRYCLMCRHVCPVGHVTNLETFTPHGWGLTIAAERRGLLEWNPEIVRVIYSCADCGNCRSHCVTDQPLPDAIAATRAHIVARNLAPEEMLELGKAFELWSNPFKEQAPELVSGQGETALFIGDEASYLWPDGIEAAQKLLIALGVQPIYIGVGRNNGYLASSLGFPEIARSLAQANLQELKDSKARRMLVLSPGDYYAFHDLYRERLELRWPEEVVLIELTSYLAEQLEAGTLKFKPTADDTPYAYIDPAHAVRVPARHDAPRKLLGAIRGGPQRELFWRRDRAHPAGSTALQFARPDIAEHLTRARLQDAVQAGAKILISEDAATLQKLSLMAEQFDLRVQGLYESLAAQVYQV